jgi:antitoxin ParD1/3/4
VAGTIRKSRRRQDALKLEALRMRIKAGVDALERGDFIEIDEVDLENYLERLTVQAPQVG